MKVSRKRWSFNGSTVSLCEKMHSDRLVRSIEKCAKKGQMLWIEFHLFCTAALLCFALEVAAVCAQINGKYLSVGQGTMLGYRSMLGAIWDQDNPINFAPVVPQYISQLNLFLNVFDTCTFNQWFEIWSGNWTEKLSVLIPVSLFVWKFISEWVLLKVPGVSANANEESWKPQRCATSKLKLTKPT